MLASNRPFDVNMLVQCKKVRYAMTHAVRINSEKGIFFFCLVIENYYYIITITKLLLRKISFPNRLQINSP